MIKTVAFATLLAVNCGANAAVTWNFSYTGFLDQNTGIFSDSYKISGSFSGQDGNRDGYLDKSEISSFVLNGTDYIGCAADSNQYYQCGTDRFLFRIAGSKLDFAAGIGGTDPEGYIMKGHYFTAGDRETDYLLTPYSYSESAYLWTNQTKFSVGKQRAPLAMYSLAQVSAVPEPGTWAMLAAGLLVVTGIGRRNKEALPVRS